MQRSDKKHKVFENYGATPRQGGGIVTVRTKAREGHFFCADVFYEWPLIGNSEFA